MLKRILIFAVFILLLSNKGFTQGIQIAAKQMDVGYIVDYQSVFGKTPSTAKIDFLKSNKVFFYKEGYYTKTYQFEDKKTNAIYQVDLEKYKNYFAGKVTNKIQINEVKLSAKSPVSDYQPPAYNPYNAYNTNTYAADFIEQAITTSMPYFSTTILQTLKNDGIRAYANDGKKIDSLRYEINADITHFWVLWKKHNPAAVTVKWSIYDNYLKRNVYTVETAGAAEASDLKQLLMQCVIAASKNLMNDITVQKYLLNDVSEINSNVSIQKIIIPKVTPKEGLSNAEIIKKCISSTVTIKTENGHGSGFIITQDGYIVTNKHVVENAKDIEVIFSNGFVLYPKVILESTNPDLALLKVDGKGFPVLTLSVSECETGDELIVIGTPKDIALGQTVSRGIISGKREFQGSVYIQTDASINPGNSGGPILNLKGEVIAVATYKTVDAEGISFGIPVEDVIKALNLVLEQKINE